MRTQHKLAWATAARTAIEATWRNWATLLQAPPLEPSVRAALAERVVRWTLPALWLVVLTAPAVVFATVRLREPTRFVPAAIVLCALVRLSVLTRTAAFLRAAAELAVVLFVAIAVGVLLNGVHAPIYAAGTVLLALVIPVFGTRWGLTAGMGLIAVGATWLGLDRAGLTLAVPVPAPATRVALYCVYVCFAVVVHGGAQLLLAEALEEARNERHEAEAAREAEAASELAFRAVFDQASVGMLLLTPSGEIAQLNHHAAHWLGAPAHQLCGMPLSASPVWNAEQRAVLSQAVAEAAAGKCSQHELIIVKPLGARLVFQLRLSPFHAPNDSLGPVIVEVVELTDLIDTRTMLARAPRLEALGTLSGGVAPAINNGLTAILGGGELVRAGHRRGHPQQVEAGLEMIDSSVLRVSALTKQLLAFGRQDRFETKDIDVNQLVRDMGRLFARTLHKDIRLEVRESERPAFIRGDMAALEHALLNLALNAQDAMPGGGTLELSVSLRTVDDAARVLVHGRIATGPAVVISVADSGTGMSGAVVERIFEPFFTTKATGHGSGLGLAAVHGTVRNHHGAIALHTEPSAGTRFDLYLPAIPASHGAHLARQSGQREPAPARLHARVLLADDEPIVRMLLMSMLTGAGCEVDAASDGQALVDALTAGAKPDIIVTDLIMPGLSGKQLVQTLEQKRPGCPLLLITGFTGEDVSEALSGRSQHQLLRKPFSRAELLEALHALLTQTDLSLRRADSPAVEPNILQAR